MNIIEAIILGVIQGLTEFIPVSSSGHLVLFHEAFGSGIQNTLAFDVALHSGTLLALMVFFRRELLELLLGLLGKNDKQRLAWLIAAATVPAALAGMMLSDLAEDTFRTPALVAVNLVVIGVLMIVAENVMTKRRKHTGLEKISNSQALTMGLAQALALIPGVSRSGSTITAGLFMGLDRVAATRFSFLLAVPIISGAVAKIVIDGGLQGSSDELGIFVTGIAAAFISGLFAIRFLLRFLAKHSLHVFAYYRFGLAAIVLLALLFR